MKKSAILAVPLLALAMLIALTPSARASIIDRAQELYGHLCTRFCGCHHHHHGHEWCNGHQHYWCPGHR